MTKIVQFINTIATSTTTKTNGSSLQKLNGGSFIQKTTGMAYSMTGVEDVVSTSIVSDKIFKKINLKKQTSKFFRSESESDSSDTSDSEEDTDNRLDMFDSKQTTQQWTGGGYDIESEDDDDQSTRRPKSKSKKISKSVLIIKKCLEITNLIKKEKKDWKKVLEVFKQVEKSIAAVSKEAPTCSTKARWRTNAAYYAVKTWILKNNIFSVEFLDGDKRDNIPPEEMQLAPLLAPIEYWEMCFLLQTTGASVVSRKKMSKANSKAKGKLILRVEKLMQSKQAKTFYAHMTTAAPFVAGKSNTDVVAVKTSKVTSSKIKKKKQSGKSATKSKIAMHQPETSSISTSNNPLNNSITPFLEINFEEDIAEASGKIFVRLQQRTSRTQWTMCHGFDLEVDLKLICRSLRKLLHAGCTIVEKGENGTKVIQIQGNFCQEITQFLMKNGLVDHVDQITRVGF